MQRIGEVIRKLRLGAGLSQFEVQVRTGIARSALSTFEAGYVVPSEKQARLLLRVLSAAVKERVKVVSKIAAQAEHLGVLG